MGRGQEQFSQEDMQIAKRHISLAIGEMQIKSTLRYHLISVRMVIINKKRNIFLRTYGTWYQKGFERIMR